MIFYAFTVIGVVLLGCDLAGRLTADGRGLFVRRAVGISAAGVTAATPLLLWKTDAVEVDLGFTFFAYAYLAAFTVYLFGLLVFPRLAISRWISRLGYLALLALASLPSFVLIVLTAPAALAGLALTRPRGRDATAVIDERGRVGSVNIA
jgi:hypothetical protein